MENQIFNEVIENSLQNTMYIPKDMIDLTPKFFRESTKKFDDQRQKDVYLIGAITILSGCLPNVKGNYFDNIVYPNLYSFILAPPSSGKHVLKYSMQLGIKYHERLKEESNKLNEKYIHDKSQNEKVFIQKPPYRVLFVPANISSSKLYKQFSDNEGKGIICETEADALGDVFKNDWGNFSEFLRKAFHHEPATLSRMADNQNLEIREPQLSIALSGTPNQLFNIINSSENGLFSRFIFYTYETESKWISPKPTNIKESKTEYFEQLSNEVLKMIEFLELYPTEVRFTDSQWEKFNNYFKEKLEDIIAFDGESAQSIVFRMGLIFYRICMVFSAIRKYEQKNKNRVIICCDDDFNAAEMIINVFCQHSTIIFRNLPKNQKNTSFKMNSNTEFLLNKMPKTFTRQMITEICEAYKIKISIRTIDRMLIRLLNKGVINKITHGVYEKSYQK
jgi:hypothetical protein